jgi:hypothetical protein
VAPRRVACERVHLAAEVYFYQSLEHTTKLHLADAIATHFNITAMLHSISPDVSTHEDGDLPDAPSQEPENESVAKSEDVTMKDDIESSEIDKKGMVSLEDMFEDSGDDAEPPASSPPKIKEETSPSPEPMFVCVEQYPLHVCADLWQKTCIKWKLLRSGSNARLLPAVVSIPISLSVAEPFPVSHQRLHEP